MDGLIECMVKRELPLSQGIGRIAMIVVTILLPAALIVLLPSYLFIAFIALIVLIFLTILVFRRTNLEYEYDYFDSEMTVDKIMSKSSRKRLHTFDFKKVEYFAPADSPRLHNMQNRKVYNYTTLNPEDNSLAAIVFDEKNEQVVLKFTPNEELLAKLKYDFPRKFYED